jgi:murein DD-endopeptidase MepM/ murein hydrolase activator NlpD
MKILSPGLATGGIAKGPDSGHLQLLHGTEAVIPLNGGSIPLKILSDGGIESGPVFNPQTETNFLLEKNNAELVKAVVTLDEILLAITGGATITSGGGGGAGTSEQVAQEALAEHDHAHPHEPAAAADPETAKLIGKIVNPLEKMNQTSGFLRNDGKTGHGAVDLAGKIGDKIMAPISGVARVLSEKESGGYGNMVEITDTVTGVKHMLAHMDKTMVKTGDVIKAGQKVGTLGNTGKSTGAHLHHEIRDKFGKKIDPSPFYTKNQGDTFGPTATLNKGAKFGSTAGGAATGNPNIARQGQRAGATQYPGPGAAPGMGDGLGKMSEKYETGGRGSGTVGWDKVGGTSYGKYQIASKVGAMKDFLKFAEQSGRGDVAKKLRDAGAESDTGGTSGKSVDVWKQMAAGGELGDLEHQFIKKRSFDPAMAGVKDPKLKKMIEGNKGLKEMMWSTAVQHGGGGASGIMNKVYKEGMSQEDLVKAVYAERGTRFGGSTEEVQKSVKNRFVSEQGDVMAMLGMPAGKGGTATAAAPGMPAAGGAPGMPAAAAAPGAGGGLLGMLGGMLGGGATAPAAAAAPGAGGGLLGMLGGMLGGGATAPAGEGGAAGGLMGMLGGMLGGGATAPAGEGGAAGGLMGMLGGMLGGGATAPGQPDMAGVPAGGAPGAIGTDISAITQAMQAQTAATQSAITTGMQDLTTRLVDKIGGGSEGGGAADPAVPTLLSEILSANREQTSAINRLIQAQTS